MYELISLTEHDYYFDCPAKIGLVRISDNEVVLIDSGNDKDAAKKALRVIESNGWKLTAIYNTHSHADHIGGNRFLQDKTGCRIFAKGLECAYTNNPILESMTLWGGLPPKELKNKFLMAQSSSAEPLTEESLPNGWKLLELPGHSFDMVGFLTNEGTAYIADCVSSEETLAKYGIGYQWDSVAALNTLEAVKHISCERYVPSHAPVTTDITALADLNIRAIQTVETDIIAFCTEPISFESLLKAVFEKYDLKMNAQQYALIGSTLRSYLASLCERGILSYAFTDNTILWKTI